MTSLGFGALAALLWGIQNVLLASSARQGMPEAVAARYVGYQTLMILPVAAFTLAQEGVTIGQMGGVLLGGMVQGLGILCFTRSLHQGSLGVMTALVSLEGVVVALLSVGAGESLGLSVALGLALATLGGGVLISGRVENAPLGAVRLALLGAAFNGIGLWVLGYSNLNLAASLFLFGTGSVISIWCFQRARRQPFRLLQTADRERILIAAAALGLGGLIAFATGAREGSAAITAVLAAQFASVATIGGYFAFHERLSRRQLVGFLILLVGVAVVAAAS